MSEQHVTQHDMNEHLRAQKEATTARLGSITLAEAQAKQVDDQEKARAMADAADRLRSNVALELTPVGTNEEGEKVISRSGRDLKKDYRGEGHKTVRAEMEELADEREHWAGLIHEAGISADNEDIQAINETLDRHINISSAEGIIKLEKEQRLIAKRIEGSVADLADLDDERVTPGLQQVLAFRDLLKGKSNHLRSDTESIFRHSTRYKAFSEGLENPDNTFGDIVALAKEEAARVVHKYQQDNASYRFLLETIEAGQTPTIEGIVEAAPDSFIAQQLLGQNREQ